jgi:hypothetical protein
MRRDCRHRPVGPLRQHAETADRKKTQVSGSLPGKWDQLYNFYLLYSQYSPIRTTETFVAAS